MKIKLNEIDRREKQLYQDQLCEVRKRKKINRKQKSKKGGKAVLKDRCKQKCECTSTCKPPTIKERLQVPKNQNAKKQITLMKRERETYLNKLFDLQLY